MENFSTTWMLGALSGLVIVGSNMVLLMKRRIEKAKDLRAREFVLGSGLQQQHAAPKVVNERPAQQEEKESIELAALNDHETGVNISIRQ